MLNAHHNCQFPTQSADVTLVLQNTAPIANLTNLSRCRYIVVLKVSGWKEDDDGEGGVSGTVFEDVDLTEKEWADYDERSSDRISRVLNVSSVSGLMNRL